MDLQRYRDNLPELHPWPVSGKLVGVRALSRTQIQLAEALGKQLSDAVSPLSGRLAAELRILSHALSEIEPPYEPLASPADLAVFLEPHDVSALMVLWRKVQLEAVPEIAELRKAMLKRMGDDDALIVDAMLCHTHSLVEFYGGRPTSLTEGQIAYYLVAGNCYRTLYGRTSGPQRFVNRELLS